MMEYKRLKENLQILDTHNSGHGKVISLTGGQKTETVLIHEIVSDCREILEKIEQGTLIELPRVLRYVDYEYAIEKFVVQWQENGRIKQKSYFSEKKAYHRLKELQE